MAGVIREVLLATPSAPSVERFQGHRDFYESNRRRILGVASWMMDDELSAEAVLRRTFTRALASSDMPTVPALDRALIEELDELAPVGVLTLTVTPSTYRLGIRHNTLREHLERAVRQLPLTERLIFILHDMEGYQHSRIAGLLDVSVPESQLGLHQARLRIRELVAAMEHPSLVASGPHKSCGRPLRRRSRHKGPSDCLGG